MPTRRPASGASARATAARRAGRPLDLTLVRHAESERNAAKQGHRFFLDDDTRRPVRGTADHRTPLTARGRAQAAATGAALRQSGARFDCAYFSWYRRTRETLDGLLAAWPERERARLEVQHHLFLRERDTGYTYDMTAAEAGAAFPWLQGYWDTYGSVFARPPGGESMADVATRVYLFLNMLFRERAGARVLIVSHNGTLRMFRMLLERWTWDQAEASFGTDTIPPCSVTTYRFSPARRRLVLDDLTRVHYDTARTRTEER